MNLESLIRPIVSVDFFKKQTAENVKSSENTTALIEWGAGPLAIVNRSSVIYSPPPPLPPEETELPTFEFNEIERVTHTVRITQEGVPANWVDVEVIDAISFEGPNGTYVYRFSNPQ